MYRRFLNNNDYQSVITLEALAQLTRGVNDRIVQAEESAEISIIEHLSENYEIESELNKGKYIAEYNRAITYPVGVHVYSGGKIYEVIKAISGYKAPSIINYWEEYSDIHPDMEGITNYSQFGTYHTGDFAIYNGVLFICVADNGFKFGNIRIPLVTSWILKDCSGWQPVTYDLWEVVSFDDAFYTLVSMDNFDNNVNPFESDNWGAIADYNSSYNEYEISDHEYVVYKGNVYYPGMDVNADTPEIGVNLSLHDPRNFNLKKHLVRLSLYELTKLIAPNNVSVVRMRDYEDSMKWLSDASRLKLNPQIPRKIAEDKKPVTDWQLATFQTDYDPYKNPWFV